MLVDNSLFHDDDLILRIHEGDGEALQELILRHQDWIFNLALRMCGNYEDAEDATQEIIILAITKLSSFCGKSQFRTWLYRVAINHLLNRKKNKKAEMFNSFDDHRHFVDRYDDTQNEVNSGLKKVLAEEVLHECRCAMLLCLRDRERAVFILGALFGLDSKEGSKIIDVSSDNFRKILSRAREKVKTHLARTCGIFNEQLRCRCGQKVVAMQTSGLLQPRKAWRLKEHDGTLLNKIGKGSMEETFFREEFFYKLKYFDISTYIEGIIPIVESAASL